MKKMILVALLAAAGCGSKKGSDCDAAIAKGIENFAKGIKEHAPNPQIVERMLGMTDKLKTVLTERCKADSWSPEVVSCFTTVNNRRDMQSCQSKLSPEQASKLTSEIAQVMMGPGGMGQRMPPGMAGHPATLQGSGADSPAGAAPGTPPAAPDTAAPPGSAPPAPPASPPPAAPGGAAPAAGSGAK